MRKCQVQQLDNGFVQQHTTDVVSLCFRTTAVAAHTKSWSSQVRETKILRRYVSGEMRTLRFGQKTRHHLLYQGNIAHRGFWRYLAVSSRGALGYLAVPGGVLR